MSIRTFFKNWSYRRRLKKSGLYFPLHCKVHGVKHPERQGGIAQSQKDDPLQLVHVALPDYPYNVYVYSISLNRVLGYLDETLSKKFVYLFGKGFCCCNVLMIFGGWKKLRAASRINIGAVISKSLKPPCF